MSGPVPVRPGELGSALRHMARGLAWTGLAGGAALVLGMWLGAGGSDGGGCAMPASVIVTCIALFTWLAVAVTVFVGLVVDRAARRRWARGPEPADAVLSDDAAWHRNRMRGELGAAAFAAALALVAGGVGFASTMVVVGWWTMSAVLAFPVAIIAVAWAMVRCLRAWARSRDCRRAIERASPPRATVVRGRR